jgi:hypothetical protein
LLLSFEDQTAGLASRSVGRIQVFDTDRLALSPNLFPEEKSAKRELRRNDDRVASAAGQIGPLV